VSAILSAIFGCAGPTLSAAERDFFRAADPLGFILFARNCEAPDQVKALCADLRDAVGRDDAPVLIDQEGGRVARLRPPHWRKSPAAETFGRAFRTDSDKALEAARLNATLMGRELIELGIDVNCAPLLDLWFAGASDVIGDRAFSDDAAVVAKLGRAVAEGLISTGVLPVIKHLPGHGRASVDSHLSLPVVETPRGELAASDYAPFKALADLPLGMTAHIVFSDIDPDQPATTSATVIDEVIRGEIGFDGFLIGDDVSMEALAGTIEQRALACVAAGCDVALHCNGKLDEMQRIASVLPALRDDSLQRWHAARAMCPRPDAAVSDDIVEFALWELLEEILGDLVDGS